MTVYKYLNTERLDVLSASRIRFTQPGYLNDIFETLVDMTPLAKQIRDLRIDFHRRNGVLLSEDELTKVVKMELIKGPKLGRVEIAGRHVLFLSLSKTRDNLLMWGHYADSHCGFIIGFDETSPFFAAGKPMGKDGLRPVAYRSRRFPMVERLGDASPQNQEDMVEGLLFTKSEDWRYEQELRIISHPSFADETITLPNGQICHLFNFPTECVTEVILGCEMESSLRMKLIAIVKDKYPTATLLQAEVHESEYKLAIGPI